MFKLVRLLTGVIFLYGKNVLGIMPSMGLGGFASGKSLGGYGGMGSMMGTGMGFGGGGFGYGGGVKLLGGSEMSDSAYQGGKKIFDDVFFKKGFGNQGMQFDVGQSGFGKVGDMVTGMKGDLGFYNGAQGSKNSFSDGKGYFGAKHFGTEGGNAGTANAKQGHKKGRTVKGFHNQHETNEASNTEEVYDEEHDEADKKALKKKEGMFGENAENAFKKEQEDAKFESGQGHTDGKFGNTFAAGKEVANADKFAANKQGSAGSTFGVKNGGDVNGHAGHHQNNHMNKAFKL